MSASNVQPASRGTFVSLMEEHLTGLIREAVSVQRHCKRARIHVPESSKQGVVRRRLHAEDINMALQWRGSEKIYATATVGANSSEQKKVKLEEYIKSEMELRPPKEVGLTVHWLAVDGIQPDIPQNPAQQPLKTVHRVEEDEFTSGDGVHVTQLLPKLLSEELQLYFTRVTTAVERGGATPTTRQQQDASLASVARDAGLQELVPFLVNYVSKSLYQHVGHPEHCRTLVRMTRSLLVNPHLHLELHVRNRKLI
jgi:transcription initiation factor TFIID subunit 6